MSLYLHRLKDLRLVWARLTVLIVRDVSEQMEIGGRRTPVPYVNAEYVWHIHQNAVQKFNTPHKHMHTQCLVHCENLIRFYYLIANKLSIRPLSFVSVLDQFKMPSFSVSGTLASVSPPPVPLGITLVLALLSSICTSHLPAFILYLGHCWHRRWQLCAKPGFLWSSYSIFASFHTVYFCSVHVIIHLLASILCSLFFHVSLPHYNSISLQ